MAKTTATGGTHSDSCSVTINLKRGDYVQGGGVSSSSGAGANSYMMNFQIVRN